jgi:hypothetical protein
MAADERPVGGRKITVGNGRACDGDCRRALRRPSRVREPANARVGDGARTDRRIRRVGGVERTGERGLGVGRCSGPDGHTSCGRYAMAPHLRDNLVSQQKVKTVDGYAKAKQNASPTASTKGRRPELQYRGTMLGRAPADTKAQTRKVAPTVTLRVVYGYGSSAAALAHLRLSARPARSTRSRAAKRRV